MNALIKTVSIQAKKGNTGQWRSKENNPKKQKAPTHEQSNYTKELTKNKAKDFSTSAAMRRRQATHRQGQGQN